MLAGHHANVDHARSRLSGQCPQEQPDEIMPLCGTEPVPRLFPGSLPLRGVAGSNATQQPLRHLNVVKLAESADQVLYSCHEAAAVDIPFGPGRDRFDLGNRSFGNL